MLERRELNFVRAFDISIVCFKKSICYLYKNASVTLGRKPLYTSNNAKDGDSDVKHSGSWPINLMKWLAIFEYITMESNFYLDSIIKDASL